MDDTGDFGLHLNDGRDDILFVGSTGKLFQMAGAACQKTESYSIYASGSQNFNLLFQLTLDDL